MKDYRNYHEVDIKSKIESDGNLLFEKALNGFEGKDVLINSSPTRVIVTSKFNNEEGTIKYILAKRNEIYRGSTIDHEESKWLITSLPHDNGFYKKAEMKLCNNNFVLQAAGIREIENGRDKYGMPIFETIVTPEVSLPCIVDTTVSTSGDSEPIRLPENQLNITIPYTNHENLNLNHEFMMYETKYKVIGFDKTHSINGIGLLIIKAERV